MTPIPCTARTLVRYGAGVLVLAAVLPACTAPGSGAVSSGAVSSGTVSSGAGPVPDDAPAATDAPRPTTTDVVLARVAWDADAAAVRASGYVSPVVESGGTCTLELTLQDRSVSVEAGAEPDATTTVCGGLAVPVAELAPGTWRAVLSYRSSGTSGTSAPREVEVPA